MSLPRRIAHVDMDAFFASCELAQYPELRGLPMVVGGRRDHLPRVGADGRREFSRLRDYAGRGVLTTATYEARALGVHSGMPTMKAAKLAPQAILLPVNFELYRRYSRLFKQAIATVCPAIEDVGIDELYADVTELPEDSATVAHRIKDAVRTVRSASPPSANSPPRNRPSCINISARTTHSGSARLPTAATTVRC